MVRTAASPLLPLLRSQTQGDLLALLYLHPDNEYSLADIAGRLGVGSKRVHDEVGRLAKGGLIKERKRGNMRLVRANADTEVARPLTDLLLATFGPLPVLREALAGIAGIAETYIFGSWAARYSGEGGDVPNDIDLLIVGKPDRDQVHEVAEHARSLLSRDVNISYLDPDTWSAAEHPFVRELRARPLVAVTQSD
jgi:predicted nucleotidyltransferase